MTDRRTKLEQLNKKIGKYVRSYDAETNVLIMFVLICVFIATRIISSVSITPVDVASMMGLDVCLNFDIVHLFTYMLAHNSLVHLLGNLYVLFLIGDNLERALGGKKYLAVFLISGIGGGISFYFFYGMLIADYGVLVGASAAIYGVIGALSYLLITNDGELEELTISSISIYVMYLAIMAISSGLGQNIAHWTGFTVGAITCMIAVNVSPRPLLTFDRMLKRIDADCKEIGYEPGEEDYEKICSVCEEIFANPYAWSSLYNEIAKQKQEGNKYIPEQFAVDKSKLDVSSEYLLDIFTKNKIITEIGEGEYIVNKDSKGEEEDYSLFAKFLSYKGIWSELYTFIKTKEESKPVKLGIPIDLDNDGKAEFFIDLMYFDGTTPVFVNCPMRPITNVDCFILDSVVSRFRVAKAKKVIVSYSNEQIPSEVRRLCNKLDINVMYYSDFLEYISMNKKKRKEES